MDGVLCGDIIRERLEIWKSLCGPARSVFDKFIAFYLYDIEKFSKFSSSYLKFPPFAPL